jgi:hypothetical protein
MKMIDSSLAVSVLGKNFVIRVMEEVGGGREDGAERRCCGDCGRWREEPSFKGSIDGGSALAAVVGSSNGGSDEGWSENGRELLGVGSNLSDQGRVGSRRVETEHGKDLSVLEPNLLGNFSKKVNKGGPYTLGGCEEDKVEGDNTEKVQGLWDIVPSHPSMSCDLGEEARNSVGSRREGVCVPKRLDFNKPIAIMTHKGVISLQSSSGGVDSKLAGLGQNSSSEGSPVDSIDTRSVSFTSNAVGTTAELDVVVSSLPERGTKMKKIKKHPIVHHHGSRFLNFQSYIQKKGALLK